MASDTTSSPVAPTTNTMPNSTIDPDDKEQARQGITALVVEDDGAMRELLQEELADAGYRVLIADGGREAIELARTETIHVVITDLRMPDIDGFDLIRDISATDNAPPIIMITAFGSIETAIKAVKLGAYDYITKPFDIEELILVIDKALDECALRRRVDRLQREVEERYGFANIIANSDLMHEVLAMVNRIAGSTASVVITGESGTGKELIARAIHYNSPRSMHPFVAVNLAAIPEQLLPSELFGYKRGAFTDARENKTGLFAEADKGTLFLDEIGELAAPLQAKLLRVLQDHEVRPVGATRTTKIDVRVVAATNRNLADMMQDGSFREDLYYRLNVFQLDLPPLRSRPDDILPLAEFFLSQAGARAKRPGSARLHPDTERLLVAYPWPGNVRELQNIIERGLTLCRDDVIRPEDLPNQVRERKNRDVLATAMARKMNLAELEREYIERVLADEGGNKTRTAQRLGLDRKTLYRKLDEYARRRSEK